MFYQICAAAAEDADIRETYQLNDPDAFHYMNQSSVKTVAGLNDMREYNDLVGAMETISIDEQLEDILSCLAGILHLGNVTFVPDVDAPDDKCSVGDRGSLEVAARLFGFDMDALEQALVKKDVSNAREKMFKNQNSDAAAINRDTLAKAVYSWLFDWIVIKVNDALGPRHGVDVGGQGCCSRLGGDWSAGYLRL